MPISDEIKNRMQQKNWSTAHLAAALHDRQKPVETITVDRWISGTNEPRPSLLPAIADALDCTPNDLLGFVEAAR